MLINLFIGNNDFDNLTLILNPLYIYYDQIFDLFNLDQTTIKEAKERIFLYIKDLNILELLLKYNLYKEENYDKLDKDAIVVFVYLFLNKFKDEDIISFLY